MKAAEKQKKQPREVYEDESKLSIILESIADGVFTIDQDWRVTSFNRAAERITGLSREKAIGQKCFDVFHASICQTACALKQTLETRKEVIDLPVQPWGSIPEQSFSVDLQKRYPIPINPAWEVEMPRSPLMVV